MSTGFFLIRIKKNRKTEKDMDSEEHRNKVTSGVRGTEEYKQRKLPDQR